MGVDIQGGHYLGVPQGSGDSAHISAAVDKQRGVQVSELMDAKETLSGLFAKIF